jgi:hypothetical protein
MYTLLHSHRIQYILGTLIPKSYFTGPRKRAFFFVGMYIVLMLNLARRLLVLLKVVCILGIEAILATFFFTESDFSLGFRFWWMSIAL